MVAHVPARTPEGTANLVLVTGTTRSSGWALGSGPRPGRRRLGSARSTRRLRGRPHPPPGRHRRPHRHALSRESGRLSCADRHRHRRRPDSDGLVLRSQPAHALQECVLRTCCVRDQRPLNDHGLARGRLRRNPRNQPSGAPARTGIARMHPHAERGHPRTRAHDAGRNAGRDHVIRWLAIGAGATIALVLAGPGAAQRADQPTELWSEYPLVPKLEPSASPSIGPLLPPLDTEAAPVSGDSTRWGVWLAVFALGLIALLLVARTIRPASAVGAPATSPPRTREPSPVRRRPFPHPEPEPLAPVGKSLPQYAPRAVEMPSADLEDEPRRFVIRRTGLVRSRFVVLADEEGGGGPNVVASSRSFWRVGRAASNERVAEGTWDDLMNELRLSGWEQESARRSDYYVSLRRVGPVASSVFPTIEAYTHASEDPEPADRS